MLAVGLLCFASFAQALGLGQIKHENWLGEPLRAEVDIFDPDGQFSPGDIRLRQVRAEEAARMGVDVVAAHLPLKFKVERKDK
ncbi:MAG: hypothetical protein OIF35_08195, partial [Cellvibrionaceae bacterium]|nr:hypothetical protein [Cellvibrionaceae bacterium]